MDSPSWGRLSLCSWGSERSSVVFSLIDCLSSSCLFIASAPVFSTAARCLYRLLVSLSLISCFSLWCFRRVMLPSWSRWLSCSPAPRSPGRWIEARAAESAPQSDGKTDQSTFLSLSLCFPCRICSRQNRNPIPASHAPQLLTAGCRWREDEVTPEQLMVPLLHPEPETQVQQLQTDISSFSLSSDQHNQLNYFYFKLSIYRCSQWRHGTVMTSTSTLELETRTWTWSWSSGGTGSRLYILEY